MASVKTPTNPISVERAVTPATSALNVTNQTAIDGTRAVIVNTSASYVLYFADDPTTAITMYMLAGILYPYSIIKATAVGGGAIAANVFHAIY